ncbi:RNA polymerase sigma factor [Paenibacillus alkalitolerans]|nr:sigma factor [Paenibacillus alkalitolerans]
MDFDLVYEAYAEYVYSFLKSHLRDSYLVEDILQETFLSVYRQLNGFQA